MKKVTFVCKYLGKGGAERVMSLLITHFVKVGFEVELIMLYQDLIEYSIPKEVSVKYLGWESTASPIKILKRYKQLRKEITGQYVISFIYSAIRDTIFATLGQKKEIIISDRSDPSREPAGKLRKAIRTFSYLFADKIVFQTEDAQNYFPKVIRKKGFIIPNPINENLPGPYQGEREKVIFAAGRLEEQKNFSLLLLAFSRFYMTHKDYDLYIYGRGSQLDLLKTQCKELEIESHVFFPGFVTDVTDRMNKAMVYVSSSDYEGISNTMLEAMAMGVPTVCTDCPVGGARMTIKNNENGILVPVGDAAALSKAISRMVDDRDFAEKCSKNSVKIKNDLSIEKICNQWFELMKQEYRN